MLRTIQVTRTDNQALRLVGIAVFILLMALGAKISIPFFPVPFTMQVLIALLSGMVLGSRDGAASQLAYLGLIGIGLPLDANSKGSAVFAGPTWGYLLGFVVAAFVTGWLAEHGAKKVWQRWLAGIAGVAIIYLFGVPVLKIVGNFDWAQTWQYGAGAFLMVDLLKALMAALMVEAGRSLLLRNSELVEEKPKN
jgi:biotin transport system substrate-specific component